MAVEIVISSTLRNTSAQYNTVELVKIIFGSPKLKYKRSVSEEKTKLEESKKSGALSYPAKIRTFCKNNPSPG